MSEYKANIKKNSDSEFYALVTRIDYDGEVVVIGHYKGRYFKTEKAALKSTSNYIKKYC